MWKKIGVLFLSLVATFSVVYAMNQEMNAASIGSMLPANATGRIGYLKQGDRIYVGTKYNNKNLQMQLLVNNPNGSGVNTWLMMSEAFDDTYAYISTAGSPGLGDWPANHIYAKSLIKPYFNKINSAIHAIDNRMIVDRDASYIIGSGNPAYNYGQPDKTETKFWCLSNAEYKLPLAEPDYVLIHDMNLMKYNQPYWLATGGADKYNWFYIDSTTGDTGKKPITTFLAIRATVKYKLGDIVFAVSTGTSQAYTSSISTPVMNASNVSISTGDYMKIRLLNSSRPMSVKLNSITANSKNITNVRKGATIDLDYANATITSNNHISLILTDYSTGAFKYYQPLEAVDSSGSGKISFDTKNIPVGKYRAKIVNEELTNDNDPCYSSPLSNELTLEVVNPLSINYTKTSQNGLSTYEYNKNVAPGTKIGEVSYTNGTGLPSLSIVENPNAPSGHAEDYQNFELNTSPTSSPVDVKIKELDAPSVVNGSLKAGDYYFRVEAVDGLGYPNPALYKDVQITVDKTTPTISFKNTSKINMKIGSEIISDVIETTNTDTLSTADVTYSLSDGISNILNATTNSTNPLQYDLDIVSSYAEEGLPTTFSLSAAIAETENFVAVTTTTNRNVLAYKDLSGLTWSPNKGSYTTSDVTSGAVVGSLLAVNGAGPFTYELVKSTDSNYDVVKGADNGSFSVTTAQANTAVDVKTATNLAAKTYHIQFKVTDSVGGSFYSEATIVVNALGQAALEFKDAAGGNIITNTGLAIKFNDVNPTLLAEGGSTDKPIEYEYAPTQPGDVNAASYATIEKLTGLITPIRTGTIRVQAKRPGNVTYGDIIVYMDLKIEPALQTIVFDDVNSTIGLEIGTQKNVTAKGTIKSTGATGIGSIIYTSSDPSIASVDKDTGEVTAIKAGTTIITAELNNKNEAGYDSNYDTVSTSKTINVYEAMEVSWADISPRVKANGNEIGDKVGTISVMNNASIPSYVISASAGEENADADFFTVVGSGTTAELKLAKQISASDYESHGGSFKVQVEVTDKNSTKKINIILLIDEADNEVYFTEDGIKVSSLTKKFGENSNTFNLTSSSINNGNVTYSVDTTDTSGTLSVTGPGVVTINKAGTGIVKAVVAATGGYASDTITMNVTVNPGEQAIAFKDATTYKRQFVEGTTFSETGELKETSKNNVSSRTITYTSDSPTVCSIEANGEVTMLTKGYCNIIASNSDSDWIATSVNKQINLYDKMSVTYTPTYPNLKAEANAKGDKVGTINVSEHQSNPEYKVSTKLTTQNADASFFQIIGSGPSAEVQLSKNITVLDWVNHNGTFKVQIEVSDVNGTETIDLDVKIDLADNDVSFTESGNKITSLTKKFGESENVFNLTSISSNGGGATYSVTPDPNSVLDVSGTGVVTIKSAGTASVQVLIASGNGYEQKAVTMPITIIPGDQSIAFQDTTTLSRPFEVNTTFMESANLKETSLNTASSRAITYISNTPAICSIAPNGEVTMLTIGTCDIDAKNTDSDWNSVTTNKRIVLYDKMGVTYTAVTPNLKAEANAIADQVGTIDVNGNQGAPTYQISTASTSQNADASFFQVIGNGPTADLKLAKKISATDWVSHSGIFKVQVDVKDNNGTETIDIIVNVDEADNDFYFTDSGSKITSLTKQYGENGNSFNLTSTSSNGGSVTYSVDTADTSGTLSVTGTSVTINKTGTGVVKAVVASGSGYAGKTITMNVNVTKGTQAIAFKDTTTVNQAFTVNGTFSDPAELKETSLNTSSGRLITYTSNDTSVCTIDAVGTVTMLTTGTCDIDAKNSDSDWLSVTTNKKINLYDGMGVSFTENGVPQAETVTASSGAKVGNLTVNGGLDPKTFAVSTASDAKNKDASYFQVNSSGIVSFKKAIQATDLIGKYNTTKKVYEMYVQFDTTDSGNTTVTTDAIVEIKGAPLKAEFNTNGTGKVTEEYGPGKTFTLDLASNKGKGIPTYQLKNDTSMPSDVLDSVDASGLVTIQHANNPSFVGNPLMVEAVIPASNGYDEETIEVEVEITKASQPDFAFKTPNIKLGHGASITPFFNGNISNGTITMTSGNNALATISGSDIKAKTTDGSVVVTAINSGNRDYKSATATANVTISSAPAYDFVISVPAATYGDTGLKADIVLNGASGANQAQTWSSSDPTIADIDASKNITIKKAGTVTITCVQTSTGEPSVTATAVMVIDPKPIIVTVNDASKYVGEAVPTFSAVIPTADLVGSDTLGQPTFSCKDGTALVKPDTKAGTYDINGTYPTASYPNYAITVKKGKLTIKQDSSLPEWFHLEGATSKTTLDGTKWVNEDVNVVLDSAIESAGTYDEISLDNTLWGTTQTISKEGNTTSNVYFRINATKIIATSQSTSVKIDKTKPVVKSITGTPASRNELEELLNSLTFGKYFKPKYEVSILAEDVLPKDVKENSKLKSIQYNVYQLKDDSTLSDAIASGEMKSGDTLKLVDEGKYMVCATAQDNAGNQSAELCSGIRIKSMGESSDGKELPDINIDIDGDGIADINITRPSEKKPYLNIDTDGDGKPDINISRDGEKVIPGTTKPFLNIISPDVKWNPSKEIDFDKDGIPDFRTDGSLEPILSLDSNDDNIPDLNIDLDNDYIPDINIDASGDKIPETNIDSDGDGKPDINIDKTGTGKPQERICTNVVWDPITMVKKDGEIIYGTTSGLKPDSKDSLTDNGIIIKPSNPGSIFLPNYALKVEDVTKNVESSTKNQIIEITGANSEVKKVFDVSLSDGEKVIQPDGSILVRIPIDETIKNPRVLLRNEAGVFEEVKVSLEDGYYVFETEYLGTVSIVGDKEEVVAPSDPQEPVPTPDPSPTKPSTTNPSPTVKGTYTPGTGGALTGDSHDMMLSVFLCFASSIALYVAFTKIRKRNR